MSLNEIGFYAAFYRDDIVKKRNLGLDLGSDHWGRLRLGAGAKWGPGVAGDEVVIDIDGTVIGVKKRNTKDCVLGVDGNIVDVNDKAAWLRDFYPAVYSEVLPRINAENNQHIKESLCRSWLEIITIANSNELIIPTISELKEYGVHTSCLETYVESGGSEIEIVCALFLACADRREQFKISEEKSFSIKKRYLSLVENKSAIELFENKIGSRVINLLRAPSRVNTSFICPVDGCGGNIFEHINKDGRVDTYCSNSPICHVFVYSGKVIKGKCPECDSPFIVEIQKRWSSGYVRCLNVKCRYSP